MNDICSVVRHWLSGVENLCLSLDSMKSLFDQQPSDQAWL